MSALHCGPSGSISISGSSTLFPLAQAWANAYQDDCLGIDITVNEGGSTLGARSVCDATVDIGTMSRMWRPEEATTDNDWTYHCGDHHQAVIQINVATDGIVMVTKNGGAASSCVHAIGGLTTDQLRWIYSNYTMQQLIDTGWNPNSITNSDGDDNTHLWSELHHDTACPATEIKISGGDYYSASNEFFQAVVLTDTYNGEKFDTTRPDEYKNSGNETILLDFIMKEEHSISFISFAFYQLHGQNLSPTAIQNQDGRLIIPTVTSLADGSYTPFSRRIYMNLLHSEYSLKNTAPFIAFGLSEEGSIFLSATGLVPIPDYEKQIMIARTTVMNIPCGPPGLITMAGSDLPITTLWAGIFEVACNVKITMQGGGSSVGAGRVCANPAHGDAVMIGVTSRPLQEEEATWSNHNDLYQCVSPGDTTRFVIPIHVARNVLAIVVKHEGHAEACINALGGLTLDQLRWIYSDYTLHELTMLTEWSQSAVTNSDGDDSTHLWSELKNTSACPDTEILISGSDMFSTAFEFFAQTVLTDTKNGESVRFADYTSSKIDRDVKDYVLSNPDAISFMAHSYFLHNNDKLSAAAIKNALGVYVTPTSMTVNDETYNPFSSRIFMNLLNDENDLKLVRPFLAFAMSDVGSTLVESIGYSAIPSYERIVMLSRARAAGGIDVTSVACGPSRQTITISSSPSVFPIVKIWAGLYELSCNVTFTIDGESSNVGLARVCANPAFGSPVDIGGVARQWSPQEGFSSNGYLYNCQSPGDTSKSTVQIEVAIEGISVAVQTGGVAANCITALGGLTTDQLRWIYSSYNETMLTATGWNTAAVPNSDNNPKTHLWSELLSSPSCPATEIKIAGEDDSSEIYDFFLRTILLDYTNGETIDSNRPGGYKKGNTADESLIYNLRQYDNAISYFGFTYYHANQDLISAVAIGNDRGTFVSPSLTTLGDKSYNPLSRRIYMNLATSSMAKTRPFVEFGLNNAYRIADTGYLPIPIVDRNEMFARLAGDSPATSPTSGNGVVLSDDYRNDSIETSSVNSEPQNKVILISVGILLAMAAVGFFIVLVRWRRSRQGVSFTSSSEDDNAPLAKDAFV